MSAPFGNPLDIMAGKTVNHEAERAVIGALMRDPDAKKILNLGIAPDLFTMDATREAFEAIRALILSGTQPDAATLRAATTDAALIEVETCLQEHVSAANLPVWVAMLKKLKVEREAAAARQRLVKAAAAGAPDHELQAILESVRQAAQGDSGKARFQWAEDFCQNEAMLDDLVEGYIPASSVGVLFGDSEAYKSFLMIDIAVHVACGMIWRGHVVKQGKVLFIAGEGGNGLRTRIKACFERHRQPMRNFAVSTVPLELCDPKNVDVLIADIKAFIGDDSVELIVLDTLNTHFGPGDENSTADMSRFRLAVLKLSQSTGATVAITHHCGHADKSRIRGNISLHNGIDWEFKLERNGDYTVLTNTKVKDGPKPPPLSWRLAQQPLPWADKSGQPINGAVLEPADEHPAQTGQTGQNRTTTATGKNRIALSALRTALIQHGVDDGGIVSVVEGEWRQAAYAAGIASSDATQDAHRKAFNRARESLVSAEQVSCSNGRYWIPANRTDRTDRTKPDKCPGVSGDERPGQTGQIGHTPYKGVSGVRVSGASWTPPSDVEDFREQETPQAGAAAGDDVPFQPVDNFPAGAFSDARELWKVLQHVRGSKTADRLAQKLGWSKARVHAAAMELRGYGRASVNGPHIGPIHPPGAGAGTRDRGEV